MERREGVFVGVAGRQIRQGVKGIEEGRISL
jgi:hypothetical protein